jgi:hypothetical protein
MDTQMTTIALGMDIKRWPLSLFAYVMPAAIIGPSRLLQTAEQKLDTISIT